MNMTKIVFGVALVIATCALTATANDDAKQDANPIRAKRNTGDLECGTRLSTWVVEEGCVWDSADPCEAYDNCGWGSRKMYYYCDTNDTRECIYQCHKPCPNVEIPDCTDVDISGCSEIMHSHCRAQCGVGRMDLLYKCGQDYVTCSVDCCCKRCGPGNGVASTRVCNEENMARTSVDLSWYCPHTMVFP